MKVGDAIRIRDTVSPYYPEKLRTGIIISYAPFDTVYSAVRWRILWSDGTTGCYPVSIIEMGWVSIQN